MFAVWRKTLRLKCNVLTFSGYLWYSLAYFVPALLLNHINTYSSLLSVAYFIYTCILGGIRGKWTVFNYYFSVSSGRCLFTDRTKQRWKSVRTFLTIWTSWPWKEEINMLFLLWNSRESVYLSWGEAVPRVTWDVATKQLRAWVWKVYCSAYCIKQHSLAVTGCPLGSLLFDT